MTSVLLWVQFVTTINYFLHSYFIFKIEPLDLKYLKRLPVIKIVEVKRHDDITGKAYKSRF